MGRSPPEGRMPAYPFTLTVPPSCFCNSERDAMSAGSGHSKGNCHTIVFAPRWMVAVYLCEEAVDPNAAY
jgi:hypothetical protein